MLVETYKGNSVKTILINKYKSSDYNQLSALKESLGYSYPWYQSLNRKGTSILLIYCNGWIDEKVLQPFDKKLFKNYDLPQLIIKVKGIQNERNNTITREAKE